MWMLRSQLPTKTWILFYPGCTCAARIVSQCVCLFFFVCVDTKIRLCNPCSLFLQLISHKINERFTSLTNNSHMKSCEKQAFRSLPKLSNLTILPIFDTTCLFQLKQCPHPASLLTAHSVSVLLSTSHYSSSLVWCLHWSSPAWEVKLPLIIIYTAEV